MIRITVVPGRLAGRVASLAGGWEVAAAPITAGDLGAALCASAQGDIVLFVASEARLPDRLANILVPHDGSPAPAIALKSDFGAEPPSGDPAMLASCMKPVAASPATARFT